MTGDRGHLSEIRFAMIPEYQVKDALRALQRLEGKYEKR